MKHLVRDRIPEAIIREGKIPVVRRLTGEDYLAELLHKVLEEARELEERPSIEEMADLREVLDAVAEELGMGESLIERTRQDKRELNGTFTKHTFLEKILEPVLGCEFCHEFEVGECRFFSPPRSRILFNANDIVGFASLGAFVEGYLLLCPKPHVPSVAWLEGEFLTEFISVLRAISELVSKHYPAPVVFEHGATLCSGKAGGCIDHAHLHILPSNVDLEESLSHEFTFQCVESWHELKRWRDVPYLLYLSRRGKLLVCPEPSGAIPSQFFRRRLAEAIGRPDAWDWGAYLGLEEMARTIGVLGPGLAELQASRQHLRTTSEYDRGT